MSESPNDLEKKLAGILSDPGAMSSIMSIVKGLGANNLQNNNTKIEPENTEVEAFAPTFNDNISPVSAFSKPHGHKNGFENRSIGLLLAIKPFLSHEKAQKLDMITQILKVVSLTEIFK